MSRAESFLTGVVQVAGPLQSVQENVVAVKLHPDAVSLMQLEPTLDEWQLDRIVTWSLGKDIGRRPVEENYPYLVDQIRMLRERGQYSGCRCWYFYSRQSFRNAAFNAALYPQRRYGRRNQL